MRENTITVIFDDANHRQMEWQPNLTEHEFPLWWQSLTDSDFIRYYFNPFALPGTVKVMKKRQEMKPYYYCYFDEMQNSYINVGQRTIPYRYGDLNWKRHWPA